MEEKDLLRTENDENQNLDATPCAPDTAQEIVTEEIPQTPAEPAAEEEAQPQAVEETASEEHAAPAEEQQVSEEPTVAEAPAVEPTEETQPEPVEEAVTTEAPAEMPQQQVEEKPTAEATEEPAAETASEMMSEIENNEASAEPAETETPTEEPMETLEQIEAEYKDLPLEKAVEEICRVVVEPDYNKIKSRVGVLKANILAFLKANRQAQKEAFLADENNKEEDFKPEISDIELKFNEAMHTFKDNKEKFLENLEKEKLQNLETKRGIIEELRVLVENETNLKVLNDKFKELQEKWKSVGPVPQNESNNLWQNYHFLVEKFFDILRINKELKYLDLKKNLEQKIKLCEQAEALMLVESINQAFSALQDLHEQWKEIGPVPDDKKEELWERFKAASDQINQRRREHYDELFAEQQNNYNAKLVLCEKAEEFTAQPAENANEFNAISDQLTELLKVWKTLGAAPPKVNEEIWTRFKGTLDKFFEKKKEFFSKVKEEQQNNYNQKLNLIIQAEGIAERTDWRAATDAIIALQQEWKKIGTTSRKHSEALWKRFRAACDKFFEAKAKYFGNVEENETENLRKKEELIQRILDYEFSDDKNANLETLSAFQREWTEIGYVPRKEKDRIHAAYREALNKRFADLKISSFEVRHNSNRNSSRVLGDPGSDRILDKERRFLANKIAQLKDEIAIWENNLGFFENSKNADLLKAEFAKKIEAAKEQVKELEYKFKAMGSDNQE